MERKREGKTEREGRTVRHSRRGRARSERIWRPGDMYYTFYIQAL